MQYISLITSSILPRSGPLFKLSLSNLERLCSCNTITPQYLQSLFFAITFKEHTKILKDAMHASLEHLFFLATTAAATVLFRFAFCRLLDANRYASKSASINPGRELSADRKLGVRR